MNGRPPPNPSESARGTTGERQMFAWLCDLRREGWVRDFFAPDWIVLPALQAASIGGGVVPALIEAKAQEVFEPPPFPGHGLPLRQARNYLELWAAYRMPTRLVVFDGDVIYHQYLHVLEDAEHIDTNGVEPRRVYELAAFVQNRRVRAA